MSGAFGRPQWLFLTIGPALRPGSIVLLCVLCGCRSKALTSSPASKDLVVLRIGITEFKKEDPLYGLQQASNRLSFEGLVGNSLDGRPIPRLAQSWNVSSDGLRWTFGLHRSAKFHDGSSADAPAVKRSLDESIASLNDRSLFPGLEDVVSFEATGQHELTVSLRNRSTFLLSDLSMAISKQVPGKQPVGTGSFVTTDSSPEQIVMSSFAEYYQGSPRIQRLVWKPYPALRTAWAAMMRGELDFLYDVGQESLEFVQGESSVGTYTFLRPYVLGVVFNSSRQPLKNSKVREGLNFAVERQSIVNQALSGHGLVAHTPVWPLHWAYDQNILGFTYDPARASAILDSTLTQPNRNRSNSRGSRSPARLHFTCLVPENFPIWERMALLVQRQLFDVGVDMSLEALPADEFNRRVETGNFDAVFLELTGASMSRPYVFWHSASPRNSFGYKSQAVDDALDAIRGAPDDQTYRLAVAQLQRSMIANPPAIFLAWGQTARAVNRRFEVVSAPENDILASVRSWRVAEGSNRVFQ